MFCTVLLRSYVSQLEPGQIFTTSQILNLGTRTAVDQAVSSMIGNHMIIRLADGVFARMPDSPRDYSAEEIVQKKAEFQSKKSFAYGSTLTTQFDLTDYNKRFAPTLTEKKLSTNRSSSKIQTMAGTVEWRCTSGRKEQLADSKAGEIVYALWHLGQSQCTDEVVFKALSKLKREELHHALNSAHLMPNWLRIKIRYLTGNIWRIQASSRTKQNHGESMAPENST